jgi:hypothetical protein
MQFLKNKWMGYVITFILFCIALVIFIPWLKKLLKPDSGSEQSNKDKKEGNQKNKDLGITEDHSNQLYPQAHRFAEALGYVKDISAGVNWWWADWNNWGENEEAVIQELKTIKSKVDFTAIANHYEIITDGRNLSSDIQRHVSESDYRPYKWLWAS